MKQKFRFLYRSGNTYHWESTTRLSGDSRVEHISCGVDWFWGWLSRRKETR